MFPFHSSPNQPKEVSLQNLVPEKIGQFGKTITSRVRKEKTVCRALEKIRTEVLSNVQMDPGQIEEVVLNKRLDG